MPRYTIPLTKDTVAASSTLPISQRHAVKICRAINRLPLSRARAIVNGLAKHITPLPRRLGAGRKYYSSAATQIASLLNTIAANARARGFEPETMQLLISAHRGPTMFRARRKRRFGIRLKFTHVQAVLKRGEQHGA